MNKIKFPIISNTPVIDLHSSQGKKRTVDVTVSLYDFEPILREWSCIPFGGNIRLPQENRIVNEILKSISEEKNYHFPSSLHFVASSFTLDDLDEFGKKLCVLTFDESMGFIDGGHRLLSLRLALLTLTFEQITFTITIHTGLNEKEAKKLAIILNSSVPHSRSSLQNFSGQYDWMKEKLRPYLIQYYDGQRDVPNDPYCNINRIPYLLLALDLEYQPIYIRQQHPFYLGKNGDISKIFDFEKKLRKYFNPLVDDAIFLQTQIALAWNNRFQKGRGTRFITTPKIKKRNTHLPTGEVLSCKLPSRILVLPLLSGFRALLEEVPCIDEREYLFQWKVDLKSVAPLIIKEQIKRYIELLNQKRFLNKNVNSIADDETIWYQMYGVAFNFLEQYKSGQK